MHDRLHSHNGRSGEQCDKGLSYERIHEIGRKRQNLTKDAAATLINSQVTSKLDNFNAVTIWVPESSHPQRLVNLHQIYVKFININNIF